MKCATTLPQVTALENEADIMEELSQMNPLSKHTLKFYHSQPYTVADCNREGVPPGVGYVAPVPAVVAVPAAPGVPAVIGAPAVPAVFSPNGWQGRKRRLVMEYCKEGSLFGLLGRHIDRSVYLSLWMLRLPY